MVSGEIDAARTAIRDDTTNLDVYFEGLSNISYLRSYERLYDEARRDILTWNDARMAFLFDERQRLYWSSHRSYSHFILLTHSVIEYLSSRLLVEYVDPSNGYSEFLSAIEGLTQRERQEMMFELGMISGKMNNLMNNVRGRRNDFAHEVKPHFELNYRHHPLLILNEAKEVVIQLVELLYHEPYSNIIEILNDVFSETFPEDYSEVPTGELISIYQFEMENGGIYDQKLPRELHNRGIDPEEAPEFEQFENINYLDDLGFAPADSNEHSLVQLKAEPYLQDNVFVHETIKIEYKFEFSSGSLVYRMHSPKDDQFQWYTFYMVNDRVREIYPTDSDGCPKPREDGTDKTIKVDFNYCPNENGEKEIKIGLLLVHDDFEYYVNVFRTTVQVHGPFG